MVNLSTKMAQQGLAWSYFIQRIFRMLSHFFIYGLMVSPLLLIQAERSYIKSSVFPQPVEYHQGSHTLQLDAETFMIRFLNSTSSQKEVNVETLSLQEHLHTIIEEAISRYYNIIFVANPKKVHDNASLDRKASKRMFSNAIPFLSELEISYKHDEDLSTEVDESYNLSIPYEDSTILKLDRNNEEKMILKASLRAGTPWGLLRGLESFSQLVIWEGYQHASTISTNKQDNLYYLTNAPVIIKDYPRFNYRGVLIDTGFNFLTVDAIKMLLDSMVVMKSNILHWHMMDDPSWPVESSTYPSFTAPKGELETLEHSTEENAAKSGRRHEIYGPYAPVAIYSIKKQQELKEYAYSRGIMILIELDLPGHCASWGAGNLDNIISCPGGQTLINPIGDIDPSSSLSSSVSSSTGIYKVVEELMLEYYHRVGSIGLPLIHLGGDEVTSYRCWEESQEVKDWAKQLNITTEPKLDVNAVRKVFTSRMNAIAEKNNLRPMFWEETFTGSFMNKDRKYSKPKDNNFVKNTGTDFENAIVTPWVNGYVAKEAVEANFDVINLYGWYLDQWVPPTADVNHWYEANVTYGFIESWKLFYTYDPVLSTGIDFQSKPELAKKILGGMASTWGDQVDSSIGSVGMLYPRGLAIGEKLWSSQEYTTQGSHTTVNGTGYSVTRGGFMDPTFEGLEIVAQRMEHARCKLVQRGVFASPMGIAGDYGFCWTPDWTEDENQETIKKRNDEYLLDSRSIKGSEDTSSDTKIERKYIFDNKSGENSWIIIIFSLGLILIFTTILYLFHLHHSWSKKLKDNNNLSGNRDTFSPFSPKENDLSTLNASIHRLPVAETLVKTSLDQNKNAHSNTKAFNSNPKSQLKHQINRVTSLDQLRGFSMLFMIWANLAFGYSQLGEGFFTHGITFCSGNDLIEPAFHFCMGFALRLVVLRRLRSESLKLSNESSTVSSEPGFSTYYQIWRLRYRVFFYQILFTRVFGLILISMFFTEGWGTFESWSDIGSFRDWCLQLVQNNSPYHTLLHIAFVTVYTYLPMTMDWYVRVWQLAVSLVLNFTLLSTFYFKWIKSYPLPPLDTGLDEGGYFGFIGWAIEALCGSLVYDICMYYQEKHRETREQISIENDIKRRQRDNYRKHQSLRHSFQQEVNKGNDDEELKAPLLSKPNDYDTKEEVQANDDNQLELDVDNEDYSTSPISNFATDLSSVTKTNKETPDATNLIHVHSNSPSENLSQGNRLILPDSSVKESNKLSDDASICYRYGHLFAMCLYLIILALIFMILGYLFSCLGTSLPLTVCYNGTRSGVDNVYMYGGFGDEVPCSGVPSYGPGNFFVAPPFMVPNNLTNVVTMWTMTQRAGSGTYHLFTSGVCIFLFVLLYILCDIGIPAPSWWRDSPFVSKIGKSVFGICCIEEEDTSIYDIMETTEYGKRRPISRLKVKWDILEVFGSNSLAIYLISDMIGGNIQEMIPIDAPVWYFILWGQGLNIAVTYICANYLRQNGLFLRL